MPDKDVLYRSFNQLLGSLDLPDDKIEEMNSYDDHKKWEILCSRNLMKVHQSPSFYLQRLRSHVGLKLAQSKTDVTETLRGLEVSLRTYSIEWLRDFLSWKKSLDTLAELIDCSLSSDQLQILTQCLKVIINDAVGFSAIINHQKLPDALVRCLSTVSSRNKCNILQLMAMACEKSLRGHDRVLNSLRLNGGLEELMDFLTLNRKSEQLVIVATLNFIKSAVNSPLDLNYQVYLQFKFRKIGLESLIERLMLNESSLISEVIEEIKNYKSIIINVNQLVKDREALEGRLKKSETKLMDLERQSINGVRLPNDFRCQKDYVLASKSFALKSPSQIFVHPLFGRVDLYEKYLIKLIHRKFMSYKTKKIYYSSSHFFHIAGKKLGNEQERWSRRNVREKL